MAAVTWHDLQIFPGNVENNWKWIPLMPVVERCKTMSVTNFESDVLQVRQEIPRSDQEASDKDLG